MEEESTNNLHSIFESLEDPRVERTKRHQLLDIILIAILGVLCGAEGWVDIETFGNTREAWLKTFLELPNGIPHTIHSVGCLRASIPNSLRSVF